MFSHQTKITMNDTDSAGVLFFGNIFTKAHEAYEIFMENGGIPLKEIIYNSDFVLPIIQTEAEFNKPMVIGDELEIKLSTENIGNRSFSLLYEFIDSTGDIAGVVKTVHVALNKHDNSKVPLPDLLVTLLKTHA